MLTSLSLDLKISLSTRGKETFVNENKKSKFLGKFGHPSSNHIAGIVVFQRPSRQKGNKSVTYKAVFRTVPATPDLLNSTDRNNPRNPDLSIAGTAVISSASA